jgi:hypothetical protein
VDGASAQDATVDATPDAPATPCGTSTSSLAGVTIRFPVQRSTFTLAETAARISFTYDLAIAADVPDVVPDPQGACTPVGPSALIVHEVIAGGGQGYCVCDQGRCSPQSSAVTAHAGTYPHTMTWDGRNWNGPSDTGNPEGAPFPAGSYVLTVDAKGTAGGQPFDVVAQLCFEVTGGGTSGSDAALDAPSDAGGTCQAASDCRTLSSYCGACSCLALPAGAADPVCDAGTVSCLLDPCSGRSATCGASGHCALQ